MATLSPEHLRLQHGSTFRNCGLCRYAHELTNRHGVPYVQCGNIRMLAANQRNQARMQGKVRTLKFTCPLYLHDGKVREHDERY